VTIPPSSFGDLAGHRALVTGAARGIGAATAIALGDAGCAVTVLDVVDCDDTLAAIEARGGKADQIRVDLSDRAAVSAAVTETATGGAFSILVSNAGVISTARIADLGDDEWDRVVAINLTASVLLTRLCWVGMRERGCGRIVYVSSRAARTGGNNAGPAYVTTKRALEGLAVSVAMDGAAHNIRANVVMPGPTETEMTRLPSYSDGGSSLPLGRMGAPEDIAQAVRYLVSDQSNYVTGTVMNVTGGLLAG
jgi:NAD(P)-dependent dehydrogenase (short-subunit alcohol dehydrogenase family)